MKHYTLNEICRIATSVRGSLRKEAALSFAAMLAVIAVGAPSWPEPTRNMKPWVYNWWMGSAVDEAGLEHQSRELSEKGFGGFHVIPIYGAKGCEAEWRSYLSPGWMEAFAMAKRIDARHGLGIDHTMGSGWCFGGPWLTKSKGCMKLVRGADGLLALQPTGQKVKRAGPGGQGLMMNPLSPCAMDAFLEKFEVFDNPGAALPEHFYHDSYEYYGAAWSDELPGVFKARRGYDLMEKWDAFSGKGSPDEVARVKCDYRATLDDLIVEEVFPKWVAWCHARGVKTRNEAHGSPANWLDFYAIADIPETEMFGKDCRDILISKFASSASHVTRKPLVAAESCTWISEHFTETLAEIKVLVDRLFLSGVNHMFYHGCCYSPVDAPWPGWCFYASLEMNPRNPIWRDVGTLNAYITRCQSIFQTCTPDNDLLVYWPIRDYWWDDKGCEKPMTIHDTEWFYGQPIGDLAKRLRNEGYAFDYVSDRMLQDARKHGLGERYAALAVPPCRHMPDRTRSAIASLGLPDEKSARREPFAAAGLDYVRFKNGPDTVYFIANQSGNKVSQAFVLSCRPKAVWRMDPMTGAIEAISAHEGNVKVALENGHSCFLWCSAAEDGAPAQNESRPKQYLDLGGVHGNESVRVTVNGRRIGTLIMPPYRIEIPREILRGPKVEDNKIELDVCERGANRIRELDRKGVNWKYFTDINMVDITYAKFDASNWPLQSHGIKGPVRIVEE